MAAMDTRSSSLAVSGWAPGVGAVSDDVAVVAVGGGGGVVALVTGAAKVKV